MRYVLLEVSNDREANDLLADIAAFPGSPLLTPTAENVVYARVLVATEQVVRPARMALVPKGLPVEGVDVPDPEALLAQVLHAANRLGDPNDDETAIDDVAGDLVRGVHALDAHLEHGGRLPTSWSGARP